MRRGASLAELETQTGTAKAYIRGQVRLAFIAPDIQQAILAGRQPTGMTLETPVRSDIPLHWTEQRRRYGLTSYAVAFPVLRCRLPCSANFFP